MTKGPRPKRGFASDNNAGVHPDVLAALADANEGHAAAYGDDDLTARATRVLKRHFGDDAQVFFVLTGTGANVLCLDAMTQPHHSIICPETAHIHEDECGAPERFTGCKVLTCETEHGKLGVGDIERHMVGIGFEHHSQPRVVSISQTTELGTVYAPAEVRELADYAHERGMLLHMDGARLCNAAAALGCTLAEITRDAGVDALSFGGTKNGMLMGEAVIFFEPSLARDFEYRRKQGLQLLSKMRYVAAQFIAMFDGDLWLENARHANSMAARLAEGFEGVAGVDVAHPVEANGVFAYLPEEGIESLRNECPFYLWGEDAEIDPVTGARRRLARLMCSWDTEPSDVDGFLEMLADG